MRVANTIVFTVLCSSFGVGCSGEKLGQIHSNDRTNARLSSSDGEKDGGTNDLATEKTGSLSLVIPASGMSLAGDIAFVQIILTTSANAKITRTLSYQGNSVMTFDAIPLGDYRLVLALLDSAGKVIEQGESNVTINKGVVARAKVALRAAPKETGNLEIEIIRDSSSPSRDACTTDQDCMLWEESESIGCCSMPASITSDTAVSVNSQWWQSQKPAQCSIMGTNCPIAMMAQPTGNNIYAPKCSASGTCAKIQTPTCPSDSSFKCGAVSTGAAPMGGNPVALMVCGCKPKVCPVPGQVIVVTAQGSNEVWPDGSPKGTFTCTFNAIP